MYQISNEYLQAVRKKVRKTDYRTDGQTDRRTDGRTDRVPNLKSPSTSSVGDYNKTVKTVCRPNMGGEFEWTGGVSTTSASRPLYTSSSQFPFLSLPLIFSPFSLHFPLLLPPHFIHSLNPPFPTLSFLP